MADVYFAYGKALLENAIAQNSVLGKEREGAPTEEGTFATPSVLRRHPFSLMKNVLALPCTCMYVEPAPNGGKFMSFSGDGEEGDDDPAVDLFAEAAKAEAEGVEEVGDGGGDGDGADEAEPEDDFNAAWEVLDLARAIYEKRMEEDDEVRLKVADTFIALGDVSLETGAFYISLLPPYSSTKMRAFVFLAASCIRPHPPALLNVKNLLMDCPEKFDQAITDYSSGIALKTELLPMSSRQLAEAHYKLSIALDLTAGRLADAIHHAQRALESIEARLAELQKGLAGTLPPLAAPSDDNDAKDKENGKGKGKSKKAVLAPEELVQNRSKAQIEAEIKELGELKQDLAVKVCTYMLPARLVLPPPCDSHARRVGRRIKVGA